MGEDKIEKQGFTVVGADQGGWIVSKHAQPHELIRSPLRCFSTFRELVEWLGAHNPEADNA